MLTDETSPDENTVSSASLCLSPSADRSSAIFDSTPITSTPLRPLTNGHEGDKRSSCDTVNGNMNVNIVSESTSMDVLSCGESDAGDTLNRRNNNTLNSISSTLTNTHREGEPARRRMSRDVTFFIADELLMTERTYKRDIELVTVTWSGRVSSLTGCGSEIVSALARAPLALEPLALPSGALLAALEKHLTHCNHDEPEYKKIADLLYEYLSTTFNAYTEYTSRCGTLVALVESVRRRSSAADCAVAAFDSAAPLPLSCLLLRPLHRLLHLQPLATELAEATGSKSALKALQLSRELSSEASEQLRHVENHAALCQLQRDIVGYDKLLVADREFLRLGCLYKHSSKGLQQRMLFLFSDVLIVSSKSGNAQFRAHVALPLHRIQIKPSELPHSFALTGENVNLLFSASNDTEYAGWAHVIETAIERATEQNVSVDTELTPYEQECGASSSSGSLGAAGGGLAAGGALAHVCWHRVTALSRDRLHLAMRTQLSGSLLRKFKNSIGWQKLWVVFAAFTLYFYKSWQDETPLASLPLLGYSVGAPSETDDIHKDFVFKLQFKNHVYFFRANSQFTYNRWTEVLRSTMVNHT